MAKDSKRIYMDSSTIEFGRECPRCLRWFVPVFDDDPCSHCIEHGCPPYPNRVRYFSVKNDVSLREISRKTKLEWRTVRMISQGRRAPHLSSKRKILRALGMSSKKSELNYVFPHSRRKQTCL
jgi:hypothetical protein